MILKRAALMGMDLQSDAFWELRMDNFLIMSAAYAERTAEQLAMVRKLSYYSIIGRDGVDPKQITERSLFPIPLIDRMIDDNTPPEKPFALTDEQRKHGQKIYQQYLKTTNGGSDQDNGE